MSKKFCSTGVSPVPARARRSCYIISALALIFLVGCEYGAGGTGELVVPREKLHDIGQLELKPAATEPSTLPTTAPAAESIELSIEQARRDALGNNLDLQVQLFDPTLASESLKAERAKFESVFTTDFAQSKAVQPTQTPGISGTNSKSWTIAPGLRIPLITGGEIDLRGPQGRNETDNPQAANNSVFYTAEIDASISIPLLRGAGVDPNAQSIRIAFYESQAAQARTKLEVIRVLTDVEKIYWQFYAARRELEVRKKEYDLANMQLERARRQVRAGTVAEVEIIRAESGVADTVQAIITADNLVRDQQRRLKRVLNRDDLQLETPTMVIPVTVPNASPFELDAERLVKQSLDQRMELLQTELRIAAESANIAAARNGTLPLLSFEYTYGVSGGKTTYSAALADVNDMDFERHSIGAHLEVPIGNEPARARLRQALLRRLQSLTTKEQQIEQVTQEVYNAVDQLQAAWQSILAAQKRTVLNARLLDVEIRQFEQGLRTSTDVLDAQTKLANAQSAEIVSITTYQIAQVDLAFATGTVLGQSRVDWAPVKSPRE